MRMSAAILLVGTLAAHAQDAPYSAVYDVSIKGESIGVAEITVSLDGSPSTYTVDTTFTANRKRGFLVNMLSGARTAIVATLTDSKVRADKIYTDRGRRETTLEFDWEHGIAKSTDGRRREIPLRGADKNDRRDALAKFVFVGTRWIPGNYAIADLEPGVEQPARDAEDVETPLGVYRATSVGLPVSSSWKLTLWSAPALNGVPVKLALSDIKGRAILFVLAALGNRSVESRHAQEDNR